jgi:crotonobetainyl-CoA:carnitine CoA-transferase CaiB-like acyl-CoA transferase
VPDLPLDGLTVLDFTEHVAGASCAMYLGDFGASVIKVEAPPGGDHARSWGSARYGEHGEFSSLFLAFNRNKQSIVLDLKLDEGRAVAHRLVSRADVLLESFTPGVADRLGIGYGTVAALKPDIVYCSVSGFGQDGPQRRDRGFDFLLQAYAGPLSITGEPGRASVRFGPSAIDALTGSHAALGVMIALHERMRSGRGQWIDTSLYDATLQMMSHLIADYTGTGQLPGKFGPYFPFAAPYGMFLASDREFFLGVSNDAMWRSFCGVAGLDTLAADARYDLNIGRLEHRAELYAALIDIFARGPVTHWLGVADAAGVPATLVHDVSEVIVQPQATARQMVVGVGIQDVQSAGIPIKLSRTPGVRRTRPPELGADAEAVLDWAGYSSAEIERLRVASVIPSA